MANAFTLTREVVYGGPEGKELVRKYGTLVIDSGAGGTAAELPMSLFGLTKILAVGPIMADSEDAIWIAAPSEDGESVMTFQVSTTLVNVDLSTDTYYLWIEGEA
jgi:hypothetical protein